MELKILTWNMNHWRQSESSREAAWRYMWDEIEPDIALLQEFVPPQEASEFHSIQNAFGGRMKWGTTIISEDPGLDQIELRDFIPNALSCADLRIEHDATPLSVMSLYRPIEAGNVTPNLHVMFTDLTSHLLGEMGKRLVVIGGDFNTSTQWESDGKRYKGASPTILFERIENYGLVNG